MEDQKSSNKKEESMLKGIRILKMNFKTKKIMVDYNLYILTEQH